MEDLETLLKDNKLALQQLKQSNVTNTFTSYDGIWTGLELSNETKLVISTKIFDGYDGVHFEIVDNTEYKCRIDLDDAEKIESELELEEDK